jgi:hypothetical protein
MTSKSLSFVNFKKMIKELQDVLIKENGVRVESAKSEDDWDLVESVEIKPTSLIIKTENTIMIFEDEKLTRAKIRRRK